MGVLDGKVALVTGGSRGIGRAIVERLARDGAWVLFNYRTHRAAAEEVMTSVRDAGGDAMGVQADQEDPASVDLLFDALRQYSDQLDILVNNAATTTAGSIAELTSEEFDRVLTVNTKVPLLAIQRAERMMRDHGRIINISTLNTLVPAQGRALYIASKGALEQLGAVAAREFGERDITVNNVLPGATDTAMLRESNAPEALDQILDVTALRRLGEPADVANVVAFLAGPDSQWVTGQNLRATGGLMV